MKSLLSPLARFRSSWPMIGLIIVVSAVLIGGVLLLHFWKGVPISRLTRDPIGIIGVPSYTGFLSQIGIFFWSASAAICMFSAKVLSKHPDCLKIKHFLFVSGLLTLLLGLDDVFLLHENFFPRFVGVPETVVIASYLGCVLFCLVRFYSVILKTDYILLGMALIFFGVSNILDLLDPFPFLDSYLYEDGAKLVGIVSWLSYFFRVGAFAVYRNAAQQGAASDGYSA